MFKPKTYAELTACMLTGALVHIGTSKGYINAIQREDGSGRCWNVTISAEPSGEETIEFVRTA